MITETSAVNFRQNFGEILNQVQDRRNTVVISKDGKPLAAWLLCASYSARKFCILESPIQAAFPAKSSRHGAAD